MRPLILITNDDGYAAKGLQTLSKVAQEFGDVLVVAPEGNSSGMGLSITTKRPVRVWQISEAEGLSVYSCDGTPVDCAKLGIEQVAPRRPDIVLSGINHGSNSSINVMYSGTMGAVLEATAMGFNAIGFSLLNHSPEADFSVCEPYVRRVVERVMEKGLPELVALNVNIPRLPADEIKGIRICHEAKAQWLDCFQKRIDPRGIPYYWLTGKFSCPEPPEGSDEWALANGYVSVVPTSCDFTHYDSIDKLTDIELCECLNA